MLTCCQSPSGATPATAGPADITFPSAGDRTSSTGTARRSGVRSGSRKKATTASGRRASAAAVRGRRRRAARAAGAAATAVAGAASRSMRGMGASLGCRSMAGAVLVRDLRRSFGTTLAVDGATWSAESGTVTAVLGPNGAGKTTTVECLEGLQRPDGGQVRVLGTDPWGSGPDHRARVGVMLQDGGLPTTARPLTLLRHLSSLYAAPGPRRRARQPARHRRLLGDDGATDVGGPAPARRPRGRPAAPPGRPLPRRAHCGARPARAARRLGPRPDRGGPRCLPRRHDALLRGGRADRRPGRHPRLGPGRRRRHARRRARGSAAWRTSTSRSPRAPPGERRSAAAEPVSSRRRSSRPARCWRTASSCSSPWSFRRWPSSRSP